MSGRLSDQPCAKNCPRRVVGCHGTCEEYANWHKQRTEFIERRHEVKKVDEEYTYKLIVTVGHRHRGAEVMCEISVRRQNNECADDAVLYKAKCNALDRELQDTLRDNTRLRKQNKQYRIDRMKAYQKGIKGDEWQTVKWMCIVCWLFGMVTSFIIVTIILLFSGV